MTILCIVYNKVIHDIKSLKSELKYFATGTKDNTNKILKIRDKIIDKQNLLLLIEGIDDNFFINMNDGNKYYLGTTENIKNDDDILDFLSSEILKVFQTVN